MNIDHLKICYIGGGSRNWAWVLMQDLAFEKEIAGTIELYDIKPEDARTNEIIGNALMAKHNGGLWKFHANPSLEDSLSGSDFVFVSILPGDFEEMAVDVHASEKYGIYQSVGDTAGVGGIIRALRTIPQFREIARSVKKYAPDAWVINYTNPMTICTRTLYREFSGIKAFGCCHEVFNTQKLLGAVLEEAGAAPVGSIKREDITTRVLGINHFTWIDKASWKNIDIFPYYKKFVDKYAESGFKGAKAATTFAAGGSGAIDPDETVRLRLFSSVERVKMDLFRRYGLIAAAGDRHLAEFCPHSWYMANATQAESWGFTLTPVSWRIANREKLIKMAKAYRDGTQTMAAVESGEEGLKILKALLGLGNMVTNVNTPNYGQMPDLPSQVVVETNASFSQNNIQPLVSQGLPADIRALVMPHVLAQEGIIEAVFEDDREKAFRVFSHDLAVQLLPLKDSRALFDEMCAKTLKS
ncbi:glucosidase [Leadbettera azotonutricia]|uniref:Putative glucosidase LplD n=1 Tax=Leadbettera azotonutricia (strain ATCC BAA-888 / DSM 13862 / ZAS-9) TaxID=545695 RepID=F5YES1_LEAAZ|nr:glucosidase [Leadbettera azotonutricia]AEF80943.1 putative glucosidase LplD [Leadbettera azotonutricia ZAS-9]